MTNVPIPPHVDPRKFADRSISLSGELPLQQFSRVCELLTDTAGHVQAAFEFSRDQQKVAVMRLKLESEVRMICQRCLDEAVIPVGGEYLYAIVNPGTDELHFPQGYDVLEVGDEPLDLYTLIEDELLLSLPIIPMHPPEECQQPAGLLESESNEDAVKRSNPFSVLAQLKRDPNV
ncbi:YceD family protein [Denitrificimonas sp. JX-1]|uniref:Large ribosomal RNA subunit accumulation protein YceD n=1 Tax=Denitrificimonas halotolerans TaxID=3098930 RepID=A0ABU5GNB7_9GAMM|nr:YceD family protein [Denitrificimonas sp. JX-1]MDY7218185.1 YceD family protein [Denitrificimonas sp. JX-1]